MEQGSWPATMTQGHIDAYARVSGDFNPLHVDPAFAATTPYGGTIAHGTISGAFITRFLVEDLGLGGRIRRMTVKFIGAVRPGDSVRCGADEVTDADDAGQDEIVYDVWCRNQRDETVTVGRAVVARESGV